MADRLGVSNEAYVAAEGEAEASPLYRLAAEQVTLNEAVERLQADLIEDDQRQLVFDSYDLIQAEADERALDILSERFARRRRLN